MWTLVLQILTTTIIFNADSFEDCERKFRAIEPRETIVSARCKSVYGDDFNMFRWPGNEGRP